MKNKMCADTCPLLLTIINESMTRYLEEANLAKRVFINNSNKDVQNSENALQFYVMIFAFTQMITIVNTNTRYGL